MGAELVVEVSALIAQLDAWPDSAVVCDPEGRILFVNRAWRRFAAANDYDGADFVGQNYFAVCAESEGVERRDSEAVTVGLRRVAAGAEEAFTYRYPCHAPHQKRWFKLVATAHDSFTGARIVIVYHLNVTEEVDAVSESELATRTAMLAHDVRSGLNGVLGYVQLAQIHLSNDPEAAHTTTLRRAEDAGWRINSYLEELMLKARAQPRQDAPSETPLDVAAIVAAEIAALGPATLEVRVSTADTLDGTRLRVPTSVLCRILQNLLSNAFKFNVDHGWVKVSMRLNSSGGVEITVADGGVGMDAAMQARAFQRFSRDARQSARIEGSGLGLATVKELVEACDGDVSVESAPARGTAFTVRFPAWRTESQHQMSPNSGGHAEEGTKGCVSADC